MNLAQKIFILRREKGISQNELAELTGVTSQAISEWESGSVMPDLDKVLILSNIFDVSTDTLVKDEIELAVHELADEPPEAEQFNLKFTDTDASQKPFDPLASTAELPELEEAPPQPYEAESPITNVAVKRKRTSPKVKKAIIAVIVCICLIAAAVIPAFTGTYSRIVATITEDPVQYPYVLVHGLGGWGNTSPTDNIAHYWGADTGSLSDYLNANGYSVYEATVGPFSSAWDRACELYAQLTGTRVDYGKAHSEKYAHERYGKTYDAPLVEGFGKKTEGGQTIKINLVGHSFGGNTIRLLTHLLEYGAPDEQTATGKEGTSPLFTGGKGSCINSVTTLCSPHNGSTLYYIAQNYGVTDEAIKLLFSVAGIAGSSELKTVYDFQLDQFGITEDGTGSSVLNAVTDVIKNTTDNAVYDLSPDGAQKLNDIIKPVSSIYYFSYSYCTTKESSLTGNQVPISQTLSVMKATALLMGKYKSNNVTDYVIDDTWLANDGLVNVVSAMYPFNKEHIDFNQADIKPGTWNVMPTREGDHGTVIGLGADSQSLHTFYTELFTIINSLPREK